MDYRQQPGFPQQGGQQHPHQQIPQQSSGTYPGGIIGGQNAPGNADYYSKLSPEMLNFGLSAGQDLLNRQKAKWLPGMTDFFISLRIYFAVSNSYVLKKLSILLYPISNQYWGRIAADEVGRYGDEVCIERFSLIYTFIVSHVFPYIDATSNVLFIL